MLTKEEKREGWAIWRYGIGILIVTIIIFSVLGYLGMFGQTIVERKIYENSYQYSEARKDAVYTYKAQIAEIERQLRNPEIDGTTRTNLESQLSGIRILMMKEDMKR
ncbi:hypothetical protein [uncultured Arcobacter sp.]|uniref:hypothetical protein n=1 Tax=uncultured Arcobacter sp. TaxID=165434 RepID=UPI0026344A14|nr:hypothetical protein [uncultured Arcobacter sp.]